MFKSNYTLFCLCFVIVCISGSPVSLYIEKCKASDSACLVTSAQKMVPLLAAGIPELDLPAHDPLIAHDVNLHEGELDLVFKKAVLTGASKCKVVKLERPEAKIVVELECPITVEGEYTASGKIFFIPIEGEGPFLVKADNIHIAASVDLAYVDGSDGEKHWKISNPQHTFHTKEKAIVKLENLFNGDQEKAGPINDVLAQNWSEVIQTFGKPYVNEVVQGIINTLDKFCERIPAKELEL